MTGHEHTDGIIARGHFSMLDAQPIIGAPVWWTEGKFVFSIASETLAFDLAKQALGPDGDVVVVTGSHFDALETAALTSTDREFVTRMLSNYLALDTSGDAGNVMTARDHMTLVGLLDRLER